MGRTSRVTRSFLTGGKMSEFERTYLRCARWFIVIGPIHAFLFYNTVLKQDPDIVFCHPILCILAWIVPAMIFQRIAVSIAVPDKRDREEINSMLGITSIFLFAFQAGVLMICRITFVRIVRKIKKDPEFRRDMPYILWLPD